MAKEGEGINHMDSAPIVVMIMVVDGDINLKIAKTPHFVIFVTYSAIFHLVDVNQIGKGTVTYVQ